MKARQKRPFMNFQTNKVAIRLRTHAVTGRLKLRCQYVEIVCIKSSNQYVNIYF